MRPARFITGYVTLRVTGAEPEGFLTALAGKGIGFRCPAPPRDYTMLVSVPASCEKRALRIAAACGCEAEAASRHGGARLGFLLKRRWPAALLLLAAFFLLLESQARVWDIGIEGNETIPDGVILQALEECGVTVGARWTDFSQDTIRNSVILSVPAIRWMTVTMQGSRARVIVREVRTHNEIVNETDPSRIVAAKAGLVTEVLALHGTARAEVNRAYLPGETLIEGCATGRFGIQGATWAAGSVRARTWYELTVEAPVGIDVKHETGEKQTRWALVFGKNRINFYKGSSICPAGCDKIIERHALESGGWFILPLALEKITFSGYETESMRAEELREELEAMLMQALCSGLSEEGTVTSAVFTASETEGLMRVTLRAECEEQIGMLTLLSEEDISQINAGISRNLY